MLQTTTGSCTRKYAQAQNQQHLRAQRQERATSKTHNKNYKRVMVKLVRLFSARPAAVSLVAIGLSLPNPL